jgi:hypothetical protein
MHRANVKAFQPGVALAQFIGAEFAPAPVSGQVQTEVEKTSATLANHRCQIHGQGADDRVAVLDERRIQMGQMLVDAQALLGGPDVGTGVAADEPGGHGLRLLREAQQA